MAKYKDKIIEDLKTHIQPLDKKCKKEIDGKIYICSKASGKHCKVYAFPKAKWRSGDCVMADTKLQTSIIETKKEKVRVGQQKQKK